MLKANREQLAYLLANEKTALEEEAEQEANENIIELQTNNPLSNPFWLKTDIVFSGVGFYIDGKRKTH